MKQNLLMKTLLALFIFVGNIFAQDEALSVLNLQGVIRDDKGGAVEDAIYPFTFKIYNVLEGGTAIWDEDQDLDVVSGVYSANLGEVSAFSTGNSGAGLGFDEPYYIGVSFNNKNEISPRVRLTAAPYALALQGAGNTFPSSGTVTIGTSTDQSQLNVEGDVYSSNAVYVGGNLHLTRDDNSTESLLKFKTSSSTTYSIGQEANLDYLYFYRGSTKVMSFDNTNDEVRIRNDLQVDGAAKVDGAVEAGSVSTGGTVEANNLTIDGSAPFVIRRYDMGTKSSSDSDGYWTTTKATGVSSSGYYASVIGVNGGIGGIDATNQYLFGAFMYDTGSTWTVYSRFPGNTAGSSTIIWVLFIQKELVDGPTTWN